MRGLVADAREIWSYRSLLYMLVVRDIKSRYRNSVLGVLWSFLQPLGMMLVMTLVSGVVNASTRPNWHVYVLAGLLAWNFFSASVVSGTGSVIANAALVKKIYFPRAVLPLSTVLSSLVNFLLALPVFLVVALASGHRLTEALLLLPVVIAIQTVFSAGIAFFLATLNVYYRDTQFILELGMLALFFLTPIWYDLSTVTTSSNGVWLRRLNPMASIVNMYQDLMYKGVATNADFILRTAVTALIVLVAGYLVFRRYSANFGEEV